MNSEVHVLLNLFFFLPLLTFILLYLLVDSISSFFILIFLFVFIKLKSVYAFAVFITLYHCWRLERKKI